jgi:pimeloyl-ACP methyl ester carboxylesterase
VPIALKIGKWTLVVSTVVLLTIYVVLAFDARKMPDLGAEFRIQFEHEFDASMERETDWAAYLNAENELEAELAEKIDSDARPDSPVDRFSAGSLAFPGSYEGNWNHSYELSAASPRGVAVLLHGLTDSPYSMLPTAQVLAAAGYDVIAPRMPGHGYAIGGLLQARWEDWAAAVRIAVRAAMEREGADQSLLLVGYSNGGLLAIDYALSCGDSDSLKCPDGLVLLSPAIAVNPFSFVTNWHSAISWIPYFEKFAWLSILPEIDPFKFTSFPKRAAWELYKASIRVNKKLKLPKEIDKLPPVLSFQSIVDNTIEQRALLTNLYNRLPANGSELVVYDVNRNSTFLHLMGSQPPDITEYFASVAPLKFDFTVLANSDRYSREVSATTLAAGQGRPVVRKTDLLWPTQVYSLSHVAIPFRASDAVYGNGSVTAEGNIAYGAMAPRGEPGMLQLSSDYFLRLRYNPFFGFQADRLTEWIDEL